MTKFTATVISDCEAGRQRRISHRKPFCAISKDTSARHRNRLCGVCIRLPEICVWTNTGEIQGSLLVRAAVASLEQDEQELLLLRYVNEVPIQSIAQFYGISRFAVYRRLAAVTKRFQAALRKEGFG